MKVIEVFADISCPFAHVGLRAAFARREQLGRTEVPIVVRAWPLELVNGAPSDPEITGEHVRELREQVAGDLFAHFDVDVFPRSTLRSLAFASAAYAAGSRTGEIASLALRDALFEQGRDVSDPEVLSDLAGTLDIAVPGDDDGAVVADWEEGRSRGVVGSPHFFCGGTGLFCPSLRIRKDDESGELVIREDAARLSAFLEGCLGRPETRT